MNFFVNNRQIVKNLGINTATTGAATYTALCTTSEITLNTDAEMKDFYVFCDAIQRHLMTGSNLALECTVKVDVNNAAVMNIFNKVNTLLSSGTITQFNNVMIQFDVLTSVTDSVLTYTTYTAPVIMEVSDIGGAAEDEGEYSLTLSLNGPATAAA
mgnify:CR=1 FL=1